MRDANGVYQAQPISSYGMMLISSTNTTVNFNNDAGVVQVIVNKVGSILQGTSFILSEGKVTYVYGDNITRLTAHNLTRLDLFNNLKLVNLDCSNGSLSYLNIASHRRLTELKAQNNNLPTNAVDSILGSLEANGLNNGSVDLRNNSAPSSRTNIDTLESRGWTVLTDYVDPVLSDSSSSSGGDGSMSDATSVLVLDGMMLALQTPVAGMKGLLINGKYFIPFLDASSSVADSGSAVPSDSGSQSVQIG